MTSHESGGSRSGVSVHGQIRDLLVGHGVEFKELRHPPTRTSEESARYRGEPLDVGAKAIVMKVGDNFAVFVISAARRIDAARIRARLKTKKSRFASPEELERLTGLQPGAMPPFGRPIFDLDLYADTSITQLDRVAFNAGSRTDSIIMSRADYMLVAQPIVFDFGRN